MRPGNPNRLWLPVNRFLLRYQTRYSPARWKNSWWHLFEKREGLYSTVRFVVLVVLLSAPKTNVSNLFIGLVAIGIVADIVLIHTSIVFLTRNPLNALRSVMLTVFSFVQLVLAFGVFYTLMKDCFEPVLGTWSAVYFSFVTVTTLGFGDIVPSDHGWIAQVTIVAELLTGLFFLVVLLAAFVNWIAPSDILGSMERAEGDEPDS